MCEWCPEGYWECDGEGGECPHSGGEDGRGQRSPQPVPTGWTCIDRDILRKAKRKPVPDKDGQEIELAIDARVTNGALVVTLNDCPVPHGGGGGPAVPHPGRTWQIDREVKLHRAGQGCGTNAEVIGQSGQPVKVRVQAYKYDYDPQNPDHKRHADHGTDHGTGPKVRVRYVSG